MQVPRDTLTTLHVGCNISSNFSPLLDPSGLPSNYGEPLPRSVLWVYLQIAFVALSFFMNREKGQCVGTEPRYKKSV